MAEATLFLGKPNRGAARSFRRVAGDKLLVVRGQSVITLRRPRSFAKALRGLAKQAYPEGYLSQERASWD